jgi:membrane-bound lytic murein transglycosylase B/lysophospholipase L1-like esterase
VAGGVSGGPAADPPPGHEPDPFAVAPPRPARPDRVQGRTAHRDESPDTGTDRVRRIGDALDRAGRTLALTGAGAKPGVVLQASGRALKAAAAAVPVAAVLLVVLFSFAFITVVDTNTTDQPQAEAAAPASSEIPPGYLEAYQAADATHRVPWPILAAIGQVLTGHGATSPYDTVTRRDPDRFPVVTPAIAPGTGVGPTAAPACRIALVGDSLLEGMSGVVEAAFGTCEITGVDARAGRTIAQVAEAVALHPLDGDTVLVVVAGTNDLAVDVDEAELGRRIDHLMAAAGTVPVVWVDVAATATATPAGTANRALRDARGRHGNLSVLGWADHLARQPDPDAYRAPDGIHYTPAGYELMATWLGQQLAAPAARAVRPAAGDGGVGPLLLNPTAYPGLTVERAQGIDVAADLLAERMAEVAERSTAPGADEAVATRFGESPTPEVEAFWREVVEMAPVVAGDSACLAPDPGLPVPQIVEAVWRCEMLRTPPALWSPAGMLTGAEAHNALLEEAHVVAATWSDYGAAACDASAPYAGVFPLPVTATAARCDPVENVRAAARLVLDQESRPWEERPGTTDWERAAAGWATMPVAAGAGTTNRFTTEGPPQEDHAPTPACTAALGAVLDAQSAATPPYGGLEAMALFDASAVEFDAAHWDTVFATTPLGPLFGVGGACDPGAARAPAFRWLARQAAERQPEGNPRLGLAGVIGYAGWVGERGTVAVVGDTGLVPRLHNPRLVPPEINRVRVTGPATPINPAAFAERVLAKAKQYAGHSTGGPVEVAGWEALAGLGIPEHAARAYAQAMVEIAEIEPQCAIDVAYLAGFGAMESGHGTVAVSTDTGTPDGPAPHAPARWDPLTGESTPAVRGMLLDGGGAGGNVTPHPNDLSPADRHFYRQDEAHLRAVGPTQFLPATWETVRDVADGNADGVADPFNYYDGALATAVKACRDGNGLARESDRRQAALAYNGAGWYADGVLSRAAEVRAGLAAMGLGEGADDGSRPVLLPDGPITIVDVYGVQVNAAIAEPFRAMVDAARLDGIELAEGSGGWRAPEQQVELRRSHCGTSDYAIYQMPSSQCRPPTAIPGTSLHEQGLAVDFRCNGGPIGQRTRSDPCFLWLAEHAAGYGFFNLPSEAWHWSTTGG